MTRLKELSSETRTIVFYESPRRVVKTLEQFAEVFGAERQVSVCREISKVHEESLRGTIAELLQHFHDNEPRGEFVIVLAGAPDSSNEVKIQEDKENTQNLNQPKKLSKYQRKQLEKETTL